MTKFIRPDEWEAEAMRLAFDFAESYGVLADITQEKADALLAHLQTRRSDEAAAIAAEREACAKVLDEMAEYAESQFATSTEVDYYKERAAFIRSGQRLPDPRQPEHPSDRPGSTSPGDQRPGDDPGD